MSVERPKAVPPMSSGWEETSVAINVLDINPPAGMTFIKTRELCNGCKLHASTNINGGLVCQGFRHKDSEVVLAAIISSPVPLTRTEWGKRLEDSNCEAVTE